jgi:hypothetical protein
MSAYGPTAPVLDRNDLLDEGILMFLSKTMKTVPSPLIRLTNLLFSTSQQSYANFSTLHSPFIHLPPHTQKSAAKAGSGIVINGEVISGKTQHEKDAGPWQVVAILFRRYASQYFHVVLYRRGKGLRIVACVGKAVVPTGEIVETAVPAAAMRQLPKLLKVFVAVFDENDEVLEQAPSGANKGSGKAKSGQL